jgi:SAM-dependent methyltransferase
MCPICHDTSSPEILTRVSLGSDTCYELVECPGCGVRRLSPLPSVEELKALYPPQYYGHDWYKQQGWGAAFARVVLKHRAAGRFLDVGCGVGFFLDGVRRGAGWEVCGVEFAASAVEFARERLGLDVRHGELSEARFPEHYFDYIQVRNVLEHVRDPLALLKECRRILKPGGSFLLAVPNGAVDSLGLINYSRSERRVPFSKSGHVFFFPRRTLLRMFEEAGLTVAKSRTYGIRRGLASLGYWPRMKDWKSPYAAREAADDNHADGGGIVLPPGKNRPEAYYLYRFLSMQMRMLPGMRSFGLDFELILKPT